MSDGDERPRLVRIADYQFGRDVGGRLFTGELRIERSKSGRPRQVHAPEGRLVSLGADGRFTLGIAGGRRLLSALDAPAGRVVVGDDSEPFVRDGKNVFAKFVSEAGPEIRPGDEVCVVHESGELLAVGRAELSASAMCGFETGMAVKVREGADGE
ncbi:tRNA-guanine(15) transglycosylase [Halalkalicoccus paucihalophilus]|uniref:tRNA-guanine(15) transglycosylase n=1 Tax=Halalkalicoccus paucihalophilus TaxID=1008153 RepID=A0A151AJA7_9EURY|nr:PUA domain-containing protein [Halalkalicoccus paucihalophilus]KYH27655.1 tRNA-guanine(15) transglycosylase [Halalkalicoccus paucihalophilus]